MADSEKNGDNVDGAAARKGGKKKEKKPKSAEVVQVIFIRTKLTLELESDPSGNGIAETTVTRLNLKLVQQILMLAVTLLR